MLDLRQEGSPLKDCWRRDEAKGRWKPGGAPSGKPGSSSSPIGRKPGGKKGAASIEEQTVQDQPEPKVSALEMCELSLGAWGGAP